MKFEVLNLIIITFSVKTCYVSMSLDDSTKSLVQGSVKYTCYVVLNAALTV